MSESMSSEQRSRIMSRIRGKDTRPEIVVRRFLHANGYRFRLHRKDLPGTPDIVPSKYHTVVFVHGCFWHRHEDCHYTSTPKTNREFWEQKFEANKGRDERDIRLLEDMGWKVLVIWECEVKKGPFQERLLMELLN